MFPEQTEARLKMMGFALLEYLSAKGHLKKGSKVLDAGSQNLMNCSIDGMTRFAQAHRSTDLTEADHAELKRLHYYSTPRPGERTLFVSEFLKLTDIVYRGIDVCPAPDTDIVDLNWQRVPQEQRNSYDLVLNLGTTEHVVDQTNAMAYMHDALKVKGVFFHQPPSVGWVNHGYFAYHPQFYRDIAEANEYEILDEWYSQSSQGPLLDESVPVRSASDPLEKGAPSGTATISYYNYNTVLKKTVDKPFRLKLELATSHSSVDQTMGAAYSGGFDIFSFQGRQANVPQVNFQTGLSNAQTGLSNVRASAIIQHLTSRAARRALRFFR
jgi:hypothetical protein